MMFDVIPTARFQSDVCNCVDYLIEKSGNAESAQRLREDLARTWDLLGEFPHINQVSVKPALEKRGLREHFVGKYDIVYKVNGEKVFLVRFLHQSQDIEAKV